MQLWDAKFGAYQRSSSCKMQVKQWHSQSGPHLTSAFNNNVNDVWLDLNKYTLWIKIVRQSNLRQVLSSLKMHYNEKKSKTFIKNNTSTEIVCLQIESLRPQRLEAKDMDSASFSIRNSHCHDLLIAKAEKLSQLESSETAILTILKRSWGLRNKKSSVISQKRWRHWAVGSD